MPRRFGPAIALASAALVTGGLVAPAAATPGSDGPAARTAPPAKADHLNFTVKDSGNSAMDGTYSLECGPTGGDHPNAQGACDALAAASDRGANPFEPVAPDTKCTMIYGGPASAHIVGTWRGREIDARFSRGNGCEIRRWDALVPALPKTR
ncbi:SSI family serine proteinase inhibitor [Streptomyces daliensis]